MEDTDPTLLVMQLSLLCRVRHCFPYVPFCAVLCRSVPRLRLTIEAQLRVLVTDPSDCIDLTGTSHRVGLDSAKSICNNMHLVGTAGLFP